MTNAEKFKEIFGLEPDTKIALLTAVLLMNLFAIIKDNAMSGNVFGQQNTKSEAKK